MTIDLETCVHKVRAMRKVTLDESEEKCRNCTKDYEINCPGYKSVSRTEIPIRRGYNAYLKGVFL